MTRSLPDTGGGGLTTAERPPLPRVPTRELIVFPKMIAPLFVGREKSVRALERAHTEQLGLILSSQREPLQDDPGVDDILAIGTLATVLQIYRAPDGSLKALVEGRERVHIDAFESVSPEFVVSYTPLQSTDRDARRSRTLARRVIAEFSAYVQLNPQIPDEAQQVLTQASDAGDVADIVAAHMLVSMQQKQQLLETASATERLLMLLELLAEENAVLAIEQEIAQKVQQRIEDGQRQLVLHEKLRAIREEIEEEPEDDDEIGRYVALARERDLSGPAAALVEKEIRKLRRAPAMSPEVGVIRSLLDTVFELPWGRSAPVEVDLRRVARHLERTHYGLTDVKDRVLEYLAVCQLLGSDQPGTILCLSGPPGTGKSSIVRAMADAMHRPFARISLGGVRDEAEIRGHRRTYVGAMPGRIIEAVIKAGVDNPVILLDEIDKMEFDWHGNPAAALMEVLDPVQNRTFRDNYLEVDYDLSRVLFVGTANDEDGIPATLYDRLEVMRLSGYSTGEKLKIARSYLLPRIAEETGLKRSQVHLGTPALSAVIRGYTREAGVRELERALRRIYRKVARKYLDGAAGRPGRLSRRGPLAGRPHPLAGDGGPEPGPRIHLRRRRGADHRGFHQQGPRRAGAHRTTRRGDAGVGLRRLGLHPRQRGARPAHVADLPRVAVLLHRSRPQPLQLRRSRARARRRRAQGRPVGRPGAGRRPAQHAHRRTPAAAGGHDW